MGVLHRARPYSRIAPTNSTFKSNCLRLRHSALSKSREDARVLFKKSRLTRVGTETSSTYIKNPISSSKAALALFHVLKAEYFKVILAST